MWKLLEDGVSGNYNRLQTSGIKWEADMTKPTGQRIKSVEILCNECLLPQYETLDPDKMYRLIVQSYLANGNSFRVITENKQNQQ